MLKIQLQSKKLLLLHKHLFFQQKLSKYAKTASKQITIHNLFILNKTVTFPIDSKLEVLEQRIFWRCANLTTLVLPPSIRSISEGVIGFCEKMKDFYILSKNVDFNPESFSNLDHPITFHVANMRIKQKLMNLGVLQKYIKFIYPIQTLYSPHLIKIYALLFTCISLS